jgi:hypothetical protein
MDDIPSSQNSGHSSKSQDISMQPCNEAAMLRSTSMLDQPARKKKKSVFSSVQHHHKAKTTKEKELDEIEDYLRILNIQYTLPYPKTKTPCVFGVLIMNVYLCFLQWL